MAPLAESSSGRSWRDWVSACIRWCQQIQWIGNSAPKASGVASPFIAPKIGKVCPATHPRATHPSQVSLVSGDQHCHDHVLEHLLTEVLRATAPALHGSDPSSLINHFVVPAKSPNAKRLASALARVIRFDNDRQTALVIALGRKDRAPALFAGNVSASLTHIDHPSEAISLERLIAQAERVRERSIVLVIPVLCPYTQMSVCQTLTEIKAAGIHMGQIATLAHYKSQSSPAQWPAGTTITALMTCSVL